MKYKIFHNDQFTDYFFKKSLLGNVIRQAAVVDCKNLNDVFRKTNSIDHPWTENSEVLSIQTDFPRSLSVGDMILDVASGKMHVVEPSGFREITDEEYRSLHIEVPA